MEDDMGIMPGSTTYPEGRFPPERGDEHNWHVWCVSGALKVLERREYALRLEHDPDDSYTVNFANNSSARIEPRHPLWQKLEEIAKEYTVEVFPLGPRPEYKPWNGAAVDAKAFDCIKISRKKPN